MRTFERQSLNRQLMDALLENIESGHLPAGEKLPAEAELAEQLRVSRNTLRETLKTLEVFGIIESLHGQGTFVSAYARQRIPNIEVLRLLSGNHTVQSLLDARMVIEPGLAKLAAERRTEADMDAIQGSVHAILGTDHPLEDLFHMQVAKAADSPVLYGYLQAVYRQLQGTAYPQLQEKLLTDYADHEMREHQEIFESISSQDGDTARELMTMHLRRRFKLMEQG